MTKRKEPINRLLDKMVQISDMLACDKYKSWPEEIEYDKHKYWAIKDDEDKKEDGTIEIKDKEIIKLLKKKKKKKKSKAKTKKIVIIPKSSRIDSIK